MNDFIETINNWSETSQIQIVGNEIINAYAYILFGAPRKSVLKRMDELKMNVLPMVNASVIYVGMIDRCKVLSIINEDLTKTKQQRTSDE